MKRWSLCFYNDVYLYLIYILLTLFLGNWKISYHIISQLLKLNYLELKLRLRKIRRNTPEKINKSPQKCVRTFWHDKEKVLVDNKIIYNRCILYSKKNN